MSTNVRSFRITDETNDKIKKICEIEKKAQSVILEEIVNEKYDKVADPDYVDEVEEMRSELKVLKTIVRDTNKQITMLCDVMNSFITTGVTVDDESFVLLEKEPHAWFQKSRERINQKIIGLQYEKHIYKKR